jgi:SAM-dependent methyltransferase
MSTAGFYDEMSSFYHLIFPAGFDTSIQRHARSLDAIIQRHWGLGAKRILDVSCGIGTQALGLAQLGYAVTASDLSPKAIERAEREAADRGLVIGFSVVDMRRAYEHHGKQFDIVLSADNAVPHLLCEYEIQTAFEQFFRCCKPGGGCVVSVRDYEKEDLASDRVIPYGLRVENDVRYLIFQTWTVDKSTADTQTTSAPTYEVAMYFVRDLMRQAGFQNVQRIDDAFFQPIIIGSRLGD